VSVNYHTLSDFRVGHQAALDDLLTQSIATLRHRGIVTLARVAQDGTRIRASAGVGSFRREATLRECLREARKLVARTQRQGDGGGTREAAAQARAAAEGVARVEEALAALPEVAAVKARHGSTAPAKVSTTDPDARIMKLADGGFRPAYNVQFATDQASDVIVGVAVTNVGADQQHLIPMLEQIAGRVGPPATLIADGGYVSYPAIDTAAAQAITLLMPVPKRRGTDDPVPIQPTDSPAVRAWRERMRTDEAQTAYRQRAATAERLNADLRTHRTLTHLRLRGLVKVHSWILWAALAHNLLRTMDIVPHLMT
jgi:hypothetical protein